MPPLTSGSRIFQQLAAATVKSPRKSARARRRVFAIVLAFAVLAGTGAIGAGLLVRSYDGAFAKDTLLSPGARAGQPTVVGPLNYLLIGSDLRSSSPEDGQRSDTIIVAHVPRAMDRVYLVSVPRDLLVDIPPEPALDFAGDTTKINAAFDYGHGGRGGAQLVSATLTQLAGFRFDGAAVIDFSGLRTAVDVLDGVELCVDERVESVHTKQVFEPGCRMMGSAEVLDYLRQRNFPEGDFARQRHQQQFLKAFFERALTTGVLTNPIKMDALLRATAGAMTIDTGGVSVPDLLVALRDLRPDAVTGVRIPHDNDMIGQLSYVVATAEAEDLFAAVRTDTVDAWASTHGQWVNKI